MMKYNIIKIENDIIYFTNPHDNKEILHISQSKFSQFDGLNIEKCDFEELKE